MASQAVQAPLQATLQAPLQATMRIKTYETYHHTSETRYAPTAHQDVPLLSIAKICSNSYHPYLYRSEKTNQLIPKPKTRNCFLMNQAIEIYRLIHEFLGPTPQHFYAHLGALNSYMRHLALRMFPQLAILRQSWPIINEMMRYRVDGSQKHAFVRHANLPDGQIPQSYYGHIRGVLCRASTVVSVHITQKTGLFMRKMEFVLPPVHFPQLKYLTCHEDQLRLFAIAPQLRRENIRIYDRPRQARRSTIAMKYRLKYGGWRAKGPCQTCHIEAHFDHYKGKEVRKRILCCKCELAKKSIQKRAQDIESRVTEQNRYQQSKRLRDASAGYRRIDADQIFPVAEHYQGSADVVRKVTQVLESKGYKNPVYVPGKCIRVSPGDIEREVSRGIFRTTSPRLSLPIAADFPEVRFDELDLIIQIPLNLSAGLFEQYAKLKTLGFRRLVIEKMDESGRVIYVIDDYPLSDNPDLHGLGSPRYAERHWIDDVEEIE